VQTPPTQQGFGQDQPKYLHWWLAQALAPKAQRETMLTVGAITLLCERLATPLQVDEYLTLALADGYQIGQSRFGAE
jgi:type II secretory pathway predicted ATPase ExeA